MDPVKLVGIANWPTPTTVKEVRSFLGFSNFYRRFIQGYGHITKPLNDLLKKDIKFKWKEEHEIAFQTLKQKLLADPVLKMPDTTRPFTIETDASKFASGAVLLQEDTNGDWHPCSYLSKSFNETERNYEIYDRELLAIIWALTEWRHYLMGSIHPVTVRSDHKNLTYFRTARKLNRRQARWSLYLSEFDLHLTHVPGTQMIQSDALSRRADLAPENDNDNNDQTLLPDGLFINVIDEELGNLIKKTDQTDQVVQEALAALLNGGPFPMKSALSDWRIDNDLVFYKDWCYVPDNLELRRNIIKRYHNAIPVGHPGRLATQAIVQRDYWWPGMATFIRNYVDGCTVCQQNKINWHPISPPLQPIRPENPCPFSLITMDFITDLPLSDGFNSILVVVNHGSTKEVILSPCHKTIDSARTATILLDSLYKRYGLPDKAISD